MFSLINISHHIIRVWSFKKVLVEGYKALQRVNLIKRAKLVLTGFYRFKYS